MTSNTGSKIVISEDTGGDFICMQSNRHVQASALFAMKHDGHFFDVNLFGVPVSTGTFTSDPSPIRAHKAVLASVSKHLHELFTSDDYIDSHQTEYNIENVNHDILRLIVEFVYTDTLNTDKANASEVVRSVLTGAKYLLMLELANACEAFLADKSRVNLSNCVSLWCFSRKFSCLTLMHATSTFITENIGVMPESEQFLGMAFDDCAKLLLTEAFIDADPDARCMVALAWLNHDESRASHIHDILNMIPLTTGSITISTILKARNCNVLRKFAPEVADKLMSELLERIDQNLPVVNSSSGRSSSNQHWYVVGGNEFPNSFLSYDVRQRWWTKLPPLPAGRWGAGACAAAGHLVVIGGKKNNINSPDVDGFSLLTKTWTSGQSKLREARRCLATCADDHYAYAIGGWNEGYKSSVERVDLKSGGVTYAASMNSLRNTPAAVFVPKSNAVFVACGHNGSHYTSSIEKYDISANKWTQVGNMAICRAELAATLSNDDLYIVGGFNGTSTQTCVEIFNINTGKIRTASNLSVGRVGCSATTIDGNVICVLGGSSRTVETFDVREGKWTTGVIVPDMPERTSHFAFAVI